MASIHEQLAVLGAGIPVGSLEFKPYGTKGRLMATTRTINTTVQAAPVPGRPGKVARLVVTFCANFMDIADQDVYTRRIVENAEIAVSALPEAEREALLTKYAANE